MWLSIDEGLIALVKGAVAEHGVDHRSVVGRGQTVGKRQRCPDGSQRIRDVILPAGPETPGRISAGTVGFEPDSYGAPGGTRTPNRFLRTELLFH
jgi:hypothetical protein